MPRPFTENASLNPMKGEIDMDDSNIHIVKRTDQWKERAVQSYVVPRGVLCVELTPDGNTRIKIGEGNKYYSQLPYIGANIDISKYFTKEEVKKLVEDTSEATVIAYMDKQPYVRVLGPILPSASALPKTGNKDGDIRFVKMAKVTPDGKAYIEYVWFNNRWDPLSSAIDIDVSKFATKEELAAVQKTANELAKRVTLLEQAKHIHLNKSIIDSITAPFTTELAVKLSGIEPNANKYVLPIATRHSLGGIIIGEGLLIDSNGRVSVDTSGIIVPPYDDTEVKRRISNLENVAHTHANKAILDATTASYTSVEKTKLAGLENYDDTALSGRVTTLEESSHTHTNKSVLDNTTASYTTEEQTKLAGLENYTLPTASSNTLGGVKIGDNLSIDQNGVLSATGGAGYTAGNGINIRTESIDSDYDTSSEYYSIDETDLGYIGRSFTLTSERAALPKYAFVASHYNNNWNGPVLFSKNPEAVKYNTRGYTSNPVAFTYNNETWYRSDNGYWYQNSSISTNIKVDDLTGVVYDESDLVDYICSLLDTMHTESHTENIIENTGVLDVTKDNNGDLVVSKINGDTTLSLDHYTLPIASANTLGGIKVGENLSIDQDGVLSAIGGGSKEYLAGEGISITERSEEHNTPVDISSEHWVNESPTGGGSRYTISTDRTYLLQRYSLAAGTHFKVKFVPTNPTDIIYYGFDSYPSNSDGSGGISIIGQTGPVDGFEVDQSTVYTMPADRNSLDIFIRINDTHWTSSDVVSAASFTELKLIITDSASQGTFIDANVRDGLTIDSSDNTINVTPATTTDIGGVKVGPGLSVTSDGTLTANVGVEYVAGDGITINQGSAESTDITDLQWEQGSINPVNGEPDDLTMTVIRSPMIEVGLTNMLNVSAQDTSDNDMRWEASFYDSNSEFISMATTWQTLSDEVVRPDNAKYVVILLRKESETEIDENALKACEISWPIEIGKYVVTNTGVTHVGLTDDGSVIYVENGSTNTLLTFGQDLDVTNGVVTIPDYHRLVLNVEE